MAKLMSSLLITAIAFALINRCETVSIQILQPIRSWGDEVGLIFIPDVNITGEQYNKTARAIQEASELRLWVVLTGDYFFSVPDTQQVEGAVNSAIGQLERAGMNSKTYVGVGHGLGGRNLQSYAQNSNLRAIVLLGSSLPSHISMMDYPIPVLTLCGELDGLMRIPRVAGEYEKLMGAAKDSDFFRGVYRTPVIYIPGTNHALFASGQMPRFILDDDLAASISEEQAHGIIGQHVDSFLTVSFSSSESKVDNALNQLVHAFSQTAGKLQPFLDLKRLDVGDDGRTSLWTILAQEFFADELSDRVNAYNLIIKNPGFFLSIPTITHTDDGVIAGTSALVHYDLKTTWKRWHAVYESPREISMKLVSKESFRLALDSNHTSRLFSKPHDCKSLNRLAFALALTVSSEDAKERYLKRGRPIIFEEDEMLESNLHWASRPLYMKETEAGLVVRSVGMITAASGRMISGRHYCKVISPYRAMEWINVNSLRPFKK